MERNDEVTATVELGVASEETRGGDGLFYEVIGQRATPPMIGDDD